MSALWARLCPVDLGKRLHPLSLSLLIWEMEGRVWKSPGMSTGWDVSCLS